MSRVFSNTFYQIITKTITISVSLLARKLLTNHLGPATFGEYGLILAFASFFSSLSDWGTQLIGIREATRKLFPEATIFSSLLLVRFTLSLISFVLAIITLNFTSPSSAMFYGSFLVLLFNLKGSIGIIFDTYLRIDRWLPVEVVTSISSLLLVYMGVTNNFELDWFIIVLLISNIVATILAFILARKILKFSFQPSKFAIKHLVLESLPMGGILVLFGLYNRLDSFILNHFQPELQLGYYILAYQVFENLTFFAAFFATSALPILSLHSSQEKLQATFSKIYHILFTSSVLVSISSIFLAPLIINTLSSRLFLPASPILQILSLGLIFAYLNHATGYTLVSQNLQRPYLLISLLALIFNLVLNSLLIPTYGAYAAAIVTVLTECLVQILSLHLLKNRLDLSPHLATLPETIRQTLLLRGKIF
jgi:PST family polysaccharide transporter